MTHHFPLSENPKYSLADITAFNNLCFPIRGDHHLYDLYRFKENPFANRKIDYIYCLTKENKYIGHIVTMPQPFTLNETFITAYWGQDYYILPEHRGYGMGKKLTDYYLAKPYYFGVKSSDHSTAIHLKMGARIIGYLDYYSRWQSVFHRLKFVAQRALRITPKRITSYRFPLEIGSFKRITTAAELQFKNLNWNENVLETVRNEQFMQWRFLYRPDRYFIYQNTTHGNRNPSYFVVKPFFYKGVNWLKVVDYRFSNQNPEEFHQIISNVNKICKKLNLYGILFSSSQKITNDILEEKNFSQFNHEVILTTYPFEFINAEKPHNHLIMSFADSDLDMHTNKGKFNYGEDY